MRALILVAGAALTLRCKHLRLASAPTTGGGTCLDCGRIWTWRDQADFDAAMLTANRQGHYSLDIPK